MQRQDHGAVFICFQVCEAQFHAVEAVLGRNELLYQFFAWNRICDGEIILSRGIVFPVSFPSEEDIPDTK